MSRRIEIEITSLNGDVATWRAAGAKLPKGVLNSSLVPGGPVVGNVYRADVEQYMEGIEILSVMAPKTASPRGSAQRTPRTDSDHEDRSRRRGHLRPQGSRWVTSRGGDTRRDGGPSRREGGPGRRESASRTSRERPRPSQRAAATKAEGSESANVVAPS